MPEYRRLWVPGAVYFVTIVTHDRQPLFWDAYWVQQWRVALMAISRESPFIVEAGVVLWDHLHMIIRLPPGDADLSSRIGKAKRTFTIRYAATHEVKSTSQSRRLKREVSVWQRRFHDHRIRDGDDYDKHLDYIHYNPVKHGYVMCPRDWEHSSFRRWVIRGRYTLDWCCPCKNPEPPDFTSIADFVGE